MELATELFSSTVMGWVALFYGVILLKALVMAPWRRLGNSEQLHVFLGACVLMLILWSMRAPVQPGLTYHLLGVTSLTLMFGWSFGVIGSGLVLAGITLNGSLGWDVFALNAFLTSVLPVTLTQVVLVLTRSLLPKNFFIYVLGNGFLTAGLVASLSGGLALWLLALSGAYSWLQLKENLLPYFPLMFLPEAVINGWVMTVLVAFRPHWVSSFSDDLYINGK